MGSRESVQQCVGGESSETESREPRGGLLNAENGSVPQLPEWDGSSRFLSSTPTLSSLCDEAGGCACTHESYLLCKFTCRRCKLAGLALTASRSALLSLLLIPGWRNNLVPQPDTHHSGPDPIVGLHDGETQWGDPLHCPS